MITAFVKEGGLNFLLPRLGDRLRMALLCGEKAELALSADDMDFA